MTIITVLLGSAREGRLGIRVAKAVVRRLETKGHKVNLIDPLVYPSLLTFHNRFHWLKDPSEDLKTIQQILLSTEAFVIVTPEYNGSFSAVMKTIIDLYYDEWRHRPFGLVSYSMTPYGGIRAIQELKSVTSNAGGVPIPSIVTIPVVQEVLDEEGNFKVEDSTPSKVLDTLIKELDWYATALSNHRKVDPLSK